MVRIVLLYYCAKISDSNFLCVSKFSVLRSEAFDKRSEGMLVGKY